MKNVKVNSSTHPSLGPLTVQTTIVLPIVNKLLPSLEG